MPSQLRADKRFTSDRSALGGLTTVFSYTFSKKLPDRRIPQHLELHERDPVKELVAYDKPQNISLSGVWALPFGRGNHFFRRTNAIVNGVAGGWTINWVYRFTNGKPAYQPRIVENRYAWLRQMDNITVNLAAAKTFPHQRALAFPAARRSLQPAEPAHLPPRSDHLHRRALRHALARAAELPAEYPGQREAVLLTSA